MRKPLPGEVASGLFEKTMQGLGHEKFKLEPDEIDLLRAELTKVLDEKTEYWMRKYRERKEGPGSSK